jgi:hypothetical protein
MRCLALPSWGMTMMLEIDRPIPGQLAWGVLAGDQDPDRVLRDVGGEQEEADRDEALGMSFAVLREPARPGEAPDDDH